MSRSYTTNTLDDYAANSLDDYAVELLNALPNKQFVIAAMATHVPGAAAADVYVAGASAASTHVPGIAASEVTQ